MTYYIKKLDNRHTMKKDGFTHMIEWSTLTSLRNNQKSNREFYEISSTASKMFGNGWGRYFNSEGKWCSVSNVSRIPPRIYFKSEKYITLVLMNVKTPA